MRTGILEDVYGHFGHDLLRIQLFRVGFQGGFLAQQQHLGRLVTIEEVLLLRHQLLGSVSQLQELLLIEVLVLEQSIHVLIELFHVFLLLRRLTFPLQGLQVRQFLIERILGYVGQISHIMQEGFELVAALQGRLYDVLLELIQPQHELLGEPTHRLEGLIHFVELAGRFVHHHDRHHGR